MRWCQTEEIAVHNMTWQANTPTSESQETNLEIKQKHLRLFQLSERPNIYHLTTEALETQKQRHKKQ